MKDSEDRTLEDTKIEFASINQSLVDRLQKTCPEDNRKRVQEHIARILHKWII